MSKLRSFTVIVAVMTIASGWGAAAAPKIAPDIALQSADGGTIRLAPYRGKVVLVDFWASWCPPCKTSFPALDALYREYQPRGLEVLAINLDERRRDADAFLAIIRIIWRCCSIRRARRPLRSA